MLRSIAVGPDYCSFYIAGADDVDVPFLGEGAGFAATLKCVTVGCQYGGDGDTMITIGRADAFAQRHAAVFEWTIDTPHGEIVVFDTVYPEIISIPVTTSRTLLRFWTNHVDQPDKIAIGIVAQASVYPASTVQFCTAKRKPQPLPAAALPLQDI